MKEELLQQLIEKTFNNLASPAKGNGLYTEIRNAILAAYDLGKKTGKPVRQLQPMEFE